MSRRPRVFVTRRVPEETVEVLRGEAEVEVWGEETPPPAGVLWEKVSKVEGLYTNIMDRIDDAVLEAGKSLQVVSQMAAGLDNIDVAAATKRGIPVGYTPGVLTDATADMAFLPMMAASRRLVEGMDFVRAGKWKTWHPLHFLGPDISGATLGIIGMGRIGFEMAKRAQGFSMPVIYSDIQRRKPEEEREYGLSYMSMDDVLKKADFVSVHVNLTKDTHHLISDKQLSMMKPTSVLVNAARGPVVDPKALHTTCMAGPASRT